jgi:hypothetical protein
MNSHPIWGVSGTTKDNNIAKDHIGRYILLSIYRTVHRRNSSFTASGIDRFFNYLFLKDVSRDTIPLTLFQRYVLRLMPRLFIVRSAMWCRLFLLGLLFSAYPRLESYEVDTEPGRIHQAQNTITTSLVVLTIYHLCLFGTFPCKNISTNCSV